MSLTHERLLEVLTYNKRTGLFRWKERNSNRVEVGDVAGTPHPSGYVRISIDRRFYYAHRLAVFYVTGEWPPVKVDHRDLVRNNNRWRNLRCANNSQNGGNAKLSSANTSGFKGVSWDSRRKVWRAQIRIDWQNRFLGYFSAEADAAKAYKAAAIESFGEFARAA